jgi:hypothetical protein
MARRSSLRESSQLAMQVASLAHLESNWDNKGSKAINPLCVSRAIRFLRILAKGGRKLPTRVVPMPNGGIRFEWGSVEVILSYEIIPEDEDYDERREERLVFLRLDILEEI